MLIELGRPPEARGFVHKRIGRFIKRKAVGVVAGLVPGGTVALDLIGAGRRSVGPALPGIPRFARGPAAAPAPAGPPGTAVATTTAAVSAGPEFQAVAGAFGLPAMAPMAETRQHLDCPRGFVLGLDNLCYPKAILRGNSKFRKWRVGPKPPISAADAKMLRRLDAVRTKVANMATSIDLVTKKKVNPK